MRSLLKRIGLQFESPDIEKAYQRRFDERSQPILKGAIILAIFTFAVFGLTDLASDSGGVQSTRFRYMIACPLMLGTLALAYTRIGKERPQVLIIAFTVVSMTLVLIMVQLLDRDTEFTILRGNATPNFMLVAAFIALLPLSTVNVAVMGLIGQLMHAVLMLRVPNFSVAYTAISLGFVNSMSVVVCCTAYWRERLMRTAFEDELRAEREREAIQAQVLSFMSLETLTRSADTTKSVADVFGEVTVLFCDLVGFTQLAERVAPKHLVELLSNIFSRLDEIAVQYNVEKVKTIGDAYMAITGAADARPAELSLRPAEDMADFALAVLNEAHRFSEEFGYPIRFRIGMHTGSLIGGVVGRSKKSYDYWGRTVNVASRLEATSMEGRIQVSEASYWRLRQEFVFDPRGEIDLRGIGTMQAYFLLARRGAEG